MNSLPFLGLESDGRGTGGYLDHIRRDLRAGAADLFEEGAGALTLAPPSALPMGRILALGEGAKDAPSIYESAFRTPTCFLYRPDGHGLHVFGQQMRLLCRHRRVER